MAAFNFIPEIWSRQIHETLKKEMPEENFVNTKFQGEINNIGDRVHVWTPGAVTIVNYTKNTGYAGSLEVPQPTEEYMDITTAKGFRFYVDSIDKVQGALDPEGPFLQEATYGIMDTLSQAIAAQHVNVHANNVVYPAAVVTAATIWDLLNEAHYKLDVQKAPKTGRWFQASNYIYKLIREAIGDRATPLGDTAIIGGPVAKFCNFDIYTSANVVAVENAGTSGGTGDKAVERCMFGVRDGISLAYSIPPTSLHYYNPEAANGIAVKGLVLYGIKMWRGGALNGVLNAYYA
ncbi:MAG TPA: hypothetical protein VLH56_11315 [Dissulfurispiraceae bacterium]|nr:hypothetical protein [Dissulfurispiraceae bacterium]